MTSPLIEAIKKDRENWTWTKVNANELGAYAGHTEGFVEVSDRDARRIARVPDLEAALIAAEELAEVAAEFERRCAAGEIRSTRSRSAFAAALTAYRKATRSDQ